MYIRLWEFSLGVCMSFSGMQLQQVQIEDQYLTQKHVQQQNILNSFRDSSPNPFILPHSTCHIRSTNNPVSLNYQNRKIYRLAVKCLIMNSSHAPAIFSLYQSSTSKNVITQLIFIVQPLSLGTSSARSPTISLSPSFSFHCRISPRLQVQLWIF